MRHEDIAKLWHSLSDANDTAYILREVIGELSTFLWREEHVLSDNHIQSIVLCKLIFDVQRIHLYTQNRDRKKDLGLRSLHDAISCLSTVRHALNPAFTPSANQEHKSLLRRAFVSGLRILLMRQEGSNQPLSASLLEWFRKWEVSGEVDKQIVRPLLEDANQSLSIGSPTTNLTLAKSDSRGSAMFFLDNWQSLHKQLLRCTEDTRTSLSHAFWLWYDARLALLNASYGMLHWSRSEHPVNTLDHASPQSSLLALVKECAESFETTLRRPALLGTPWYYLAQYLDELEPIPHCHECRAGCSCFPPSNNHSSSNCDQKVLMLIFKQLNEKISQRTLAVFNGSDALDQLSKLLKRRKDEWLVKQTASNPEEAFQMHGSMETELPQSCLTASYVLNCSGMHCVSGETLWHWMRRMKRDISGDKLYANAAFFEVNVDCDACLRDRLKPSSATKARRVMPLSQILDHIAALKARWKEQQPAVELEHNPVGHDAHPASSKVVFTVPRSPSTNDSTSVRRRDSRTDTGDTGEATNGSNISSALSRILKRDQAKSGPDLADVPFSSIITPNGQYVFVWHGSKLAVYDRKTLTWLDAPLLDGDIHLLCASASVLCLTVKAAEGDKLSIFYMPGFEQLGKAVLIRDHIFCMSLSLNSATLLIGTSTEAIRVFCSRPLNPGSDFHLQRRPFEHPKDSTGVESQAVSFTPNARRAVLATRFKPRGQIKCIIYDMARQDEFNSKGAITLRKQLPMKAARDFGLTAIPCLHDERSSVTTFVVCCSVDNGTQNLYAYHEIPKQLYPLDVVANSRNSGLDASIHKAISLPQTDTILLLNELGHLWTLHSSNASTGWISKRYVLQKAPRGSQNHRPRIHLAATTLSEAHICCVERGKARLYTINAESQMDTTLEEVELHPFHSPHG